MNATEPVTHNSYLPDESVPFSPCRTIYVTEAMRRADAAAQEARKPKITWAPRLSEKSDIPARKRPAAPKSCVRRPRRKPVCMKCLLQTISRSNKSGTCRKCLTPDQRQKRTPSTRVKKTYSEIREQDKFSHRRLRDSRIAAGLCSECGMEKSPEFTQCRPCLEIQRKRNRDNYYRSKAKAEVAA